MSKNLEFKTFSLKIDDVDDKGLIRGYASTFGNVDLGMDVVVKGAFKKSLKETSGKIPILKDHDPYQPIGLNLRGEEDDKGLWVEGKLNLDIQAARERYALVKQFAEADRPMGLSIGYMTIKAEPDRDKPMIRKLVELKLFEYSVVVFPMNTQAMIESAKGLVGIDRANFAIQQLKANGISESELMLALGKQAAPAKDDPTISQSLGKLLETIRKNT